MLAARTLDCYHAAVAEFDHPPLHWSYARNGPTALVETHKRRSARWSGQKDEHLDTLIARFEDYAALPALITHGDLYAENLILQGDRVAAVSDLDLVHRCIQVMELAEALIYFAAERSKRFNSIVYSGVLDLKEVQ